MIFHFQHTVNRLILDKFFLKYEESGVKLTPSPEKTTLKKPSLISVKAEMD